MMHKMSKINPSLSSIECPVCKAQITGNLGEHIKKMHGDEELKKAILKAKEKGMSDPEIGKIFGITFRQLEKIITEEYGINISVLKRTKKIKYWAPKNFKEETTTVWSFKQRGNWSTHDGRYRGNWSPYIPRNVILKYSKLGDIVLDYFVGGGTTAIEAKLLQRRCIARDINPAAIDLTKENLNFNLPQTLIDSYKIFEPEVSVGDARELSDIADESIDLICAHPPYAGIINYSSKVNGDLSKLSIEDFLKGMEKVAEESYRVLKPGAKCAILIGDTRKKKHVIPVGFKTIKVFLNAGFKLRELIIKRQHNCKTTGFWYDRSIKYNFLLLAHEYLPIFEKPISGISTQEDEKLTNKHVLVSAIEKPDLIELDDLETTTVWIFPDEHFESYLDTNVIKRYSKGDEYLIAEIRLQDNMEEIPVLKSERKYDLLYLKSPFLSDLINRISVEEYLKSVKIFLNSVSLIKGGYVIIETQDIRINGNVVPLPIELVELLQNAPNLWLKEIVIVTTENQRDSNQADREYLKITHKYLLMYEVI